MGKVVVTAKVENVEDLFAVKRGLIAPEAARSVEVSDALVDTGATTTLLVPKALIERLGVEYLRTRPAKTPGGVLQLRVFGPVKLTIQGRECPLDVAEVPDDCPTLIGQVPLELLDFVVDPSRQRLIGNPEHGGDHMIDLY